MTRDQRDPLLLGEKLLEQTDAACGAYGADITLSEAYDVHVRHFNIPDWAGDGFMSTNPSDHHSGVSQDFSKERVDYDG